MAEPLFTAVQHAVFGAFRLSSRFLDAHALAASAIVSCWGPDSGAGGSNSRFCFFSDRDDWGCDVFKKKYPRFRHSLSPHSIEFILASHLEPDEWIHGMTMIPCTTMDQMNDSGRQSPQTTFCQMTFRTQHLGEVRHREIAHNVGTCDVSLRYLLMLPLTVIVLLVRVFSTGTNDVIPVGFVPTGHNEKLFFPITAYPNLQYCKMQSQLRLKHSSFFAHISKAAAFASDSVASVHAKPSFCSLFCLLCGRIFVLTAILEGLAAIESRPSQPLIARHLMRCQWFLRL